MARHEAKHLARFRRPTCGRDHPHDRRSVPRTPLRAEDSQATAIIELNRAILENVIVKRDSTLFEEVALEFEDEKRVTIRVGSSVFKGLAGETLGVLLVFHDVTAVEGKQRHEIEQSNEDVDRHEEEQHVGETGIEYTSGSDEFGTLRYDNPSRTFAVGDASRERLPHVDGFASQVR